MTILLLLGSTFHLFTQFFWRNLDTFDPETLREQGIFRSICGKTPLEVAVARGWSDSVEALFQAPELANGMAALRLRLQVVARHLPHWPKDKDKARDSMNFSIGDFLGSPIKVRDSTGIILV